MVKVLWDTHFPHLAEEASRPGPKPKTGFEYQLRVLILDLYVAWLEDPELSIGVAMSVNFWDTTSRYNALRISKQIIPIIHRLDEVGLIDLAKGSYGGVWAKGNRTTMIRASEVLRAMFRSAKFTRDDIIRIQSEECIILRKDEANATEGSKLEDYEDTDLTNKMRAELQAYNLLLADTFIDIPEFETAAYERAVTTGKDTGKTFSQPIDHHHHFIRRVFSRGSWDLNGRYYGCWWQLLPSSVRKDIYINDTPTVEVDFKGLHISILSAEQGVAIEGDPYALAPGLLPGAPEVLQRIMVKQLVLTALNARDRKSAFQSFRDGYPAGHLGKQMTNEELSSLLDAFVSKHPHLEGLVCADQGIRLMNVDARIAERVHRHFTVRGVPVLSVHDSFIIDYTRVLELKAVMSAAAHAVVGRALEVSQSSVGLDEFIQTNENPEVVSDFIWWCQAPRSPGYWQRLTSWEARRGRIIVPYSR
jgi:hypothetical protein